MKENRNPRFFHEEQRRSSTLNLIFSHRVWFFTTGSFLLKQPVIMLPTSLIQINLSKIANSEPMRTKRKPELDILSTFAVSNLQRICSYSEVYVVCIRIIKTCIYNQVSSLAASELGLVSISSAHLQSIHLRTGARN